MGYLQKMFSLEGKTALVTGARSGIGQAIAVGFADAGANLVLLGHQNNMQETTRLIGEKGKSCQVVIVDLSHPHEITPSVRQLLSEVQVDILVNNAGTIKREPAASYSLENWDLVMNTNIDSVFVLTQLVGQHMLARKSGKIISIASILSFQGGLSVPAYAASKHAVTGLTKALANEWASQGVQVNAIAPGYIKTNLTEAIQRDEERNSSILSRIPSDRWGEPQDLVGAAIFLASPASDYVNGHILIVDGGWMAR